MLDTHYSNAIENIVNQLKNKGNKGIKVIITKEENVRKQTVYVITIEEKEFVYIK